MTAAKKLPAEQEADLPRVMSLEGYFELDANDPEHKYDFWDGTVIMYPGGTFEHATVKFNLYGELRKRLGFGPCRGLDSDMRVEVEAPRSNRKGRYVYPDATVYCGDPTFREDAHAGEKRLTLTNPAALFEVSSESTSDIDRGRKLGAYTAIDSLRAYVVLAQDYPEATVFQRSAAGDDWRIEVVAGQDGMVSLTTIGVDLPLAELYRGLPAKD
jgi:Uma2 family endonuclease